MTTTTRIPVPSGPGRTIKIGQTFEQQIKSKEEAIRKRQELLGVLSHFVRGNGGWVTSPPNGSSLRIEVPPDGEVADLLAEKGFDLRPLGSGSRIEGGVIRPVLIYALQLPSLRK
jgi:hypothetical protein